MRLFRPAFVVVVWFCAAGAVRAQAADPPQPRASTFEEVHAKAMAANPPGLVFTLRTKDNRTVFHCGERIPIELAFENHSGVAYACLGFDAARQTVGQVDQFVTDRPGDAVDPMSNMFRDHRSAVGGSWPVVPFGADPKVVETELNPWLALDRPGVYKLYDKTYRVTTGSSAFTLLTDAGTKPLVSNVVTITILPHDSVWENETLQVAIRGLNSDLNYFSFKTLTYLRNLTSGMTLLHMCEDRIDVDNVLRYYCIATLVDSPFRGELFRALQADFKSQDIGITGESLDAYALLDYAIHNPAHDGGTMIGLAESQRRRAATDLLTSLYPRKRGRARAVTAATLAYGDVARTHYTLDLIGCFDLLPPHQQYDLLKSDTPYAHDPGMAPALRKLLEAPPLSGISQQKKARTIALQRLMEFDPILARKIISEEIRKKWPSVAPGPLAHVSGPLPDFDATLLKNFQFACDGKADLFAQAYLVGRFGTAGIRQQIEEIFLQRRRAWQGIKDDDWMGDAAYLDVFPPLFAFFYRVDPAFAEAQRFSTGKDAIKDIGWVAAVDLSPALEKTMLAALTSNESGAVAASASGLSAYGQPKHKAILMAAIRPVANLADHNTADANFFLARTLGTGKHWTLADNEIASLAKAAPEAASYLVPLNGIHTIDIDAHETLQDFDPSGWITGLWCVDNCGLDTIGELKEKLAHYPVGTKFMMTVDQKWWRARIFAELSAFLKAHGMSLAEK